MPGALLIWSSLLLCITADEGRYEYIHCSNEFTDGHIEDATCYLNPRCPDKYIYIHTVVSNEEYHRCESEFCHQFHVSPVSSTSGDFWQVFWSESDDNNYEKLELIIKVDAKISEPFTFQTNFSCSNKHQWTKHTTIMIQTIEINITAHGTNDGATRITCKSNYLYQDNTYDLFGPSGQIDIKCEEDECGITLQQPQTGEYYCILALDGISITSSRIFINSTEDETPPTQLITTAAQIPIIKITIGVGVVAAVLLIIASIAIISLGIGLYYKIRQLQDGYQRLRDDDPNEGGDFAQGQGAGGVGEQDGVNNDADGGGEGGDG